MKTFKFSLVLRTRENTDVFISLDDNIYGIHSKRINILYLLIEAMKQSTIWRRDSVFLDNSVNWWTHNVEKNFVSTWKNVASALIRRYFNAVFP